MKTIITIFVFFISLNIQSQTVISGIILDKDGPLIGANVYLVGTYLGSTSDLDGKFSFVIEENGIQILKVDYLGYKTFTKSLILDQNPIELNVLLKEQFNAMNAVTITAGSFEAGDKKKTVALSSIDQVTTAGAQGDVTGALQTLPGTTTVGESGKLFVRGGSDHETGTYIDGNKVFKPYKSQVPNLSVRGKFNPFMFQGTIFSTGGYSAEYGQALSAILLLETKDLQSKDQLDISVMSVGLGLAGTKRWDNSALTADIEYNNLSPYMELVTQKEEWVKAPQTINTSLNFRVKTGNNGLLKLYSNYSNAIFDIKQQSVLSDGKDQFALSNNSIYNNISWKGAMGEKWAIKTGFSSTVDVDKIDVNEDRIINKIEGFHGKFKATHFLTPKITIKIGTDYFNQKYHQNVNRDGVEHRFSYEENRFSLFSESDLYISSSLVFRVGARMAYTDLSDDLVVAPRISGAYKFNKSTQVSFAYGKFYQKAKDTDLIYAPKLEQQEANQYLFNYQYDRNKINLRAEVYYKKYKKLIKQDDPTLFYLPKNYNNKGTGYAYGLDLFYRDRKTIKNGDYWVSYSYVDTKRTFESYPINVIPNYVSKHNLSIVYKHWFGNIKSFISSTLQLSSPRYYTDPNTKGYQDQKIKPYRNFSLAWTYLYRQHIIFYSSISNVLGFKNEYGYQYSTIKNDVGLFDRKLIEPSADRFFFIGCFVTLSKDKSLNQLDKIE